MDKTATGSKVKVDGQQVTSKSTADALALPSPFKAQSRDWDPEFTKNVNVGMPPESCFLRIKRELIIFNSDPPPGVFIVPDATDMTVIHSVITGPIGTPYEGGFFYFIFRFPNDYPISPPFAKLLTTGDSTVRFNPNLYRNGKICLSLLRTWAGPDWSPTLTLPNILLSIQSLLSENPYHNEPGFEIEHKCGDVKHYNEIIQHETLRVAVCDMLAGNGHAGSSCPAPLKDIMEKMFYQFYDYYENTATSKAYLHGTFMRDPFGEQRGKFVYSTILQRLQALKKKFDEKPKTPTPTSSTSSSDNDSDSADPDT